MEFIPEPFVFFRGISCFCLNSKGFFCVLNEFLCIFLEVCLQEISYCFVFLSLADSVILQGPSW